VESREFVEDDYGPLVLVKDAPQINLNDGSASFVTKDSGERKVFSTGMQRDISTGKARFDLLVPRRVPYRALLLTRYAELMARGAEKYEARNWEQAATDEELGQFQESAFRHFMQWLSGETDEDHAAAVLFNINGYETTKWKMEKSNHDQ
jgi:hypothetical protein